MVERILATNKFISPVLLSLFRAPDPLTADDIEDIQTILALFGYVTTQCSSSSKVTNSLIVPFKNKAFDHLLMLNKHYFERINSDSSSNPLDYWGVSSDFSAYFF